MNENIFLEDNVFIDDFHEEEIYSGFSDEDLEILKVDESFIQKLAC